MDVDDLPVDYGLRQRLPELSRIQSVGSTRGHKHHLRTMDSTCWHVRCRRSRSRTLSLLAMVILPLLLMPEWIHAEPQRIPLGALFDEYSVHEDTAFRYGVLLHNANNTQSKFKLDMVRDTTNIADSFQLSKAICNHFQHGIFTLFAISNVSSHQTALSYANSFHMPYITPSFPRNLSEGLQSPYELQLRPLYTKAILDLIVMHYKWKEVMYIYDSDQGLLRLEQLFSLITPEMRLKVTVYHIPNVQVAADMLHHIDSKFDERLDRHVILDFSSKAVTDIVLNILPKIGMNKKNYHYILPDLTIDELNFNYFHHTGVNITGFRILNRQSKELRQFFSLWQDLSPPDKWIGAGKRKIEYQAALMFDGVQAAIRAYDSLLTKNKDIFKNNFRRGVVYNNGSKGLDCKSNPLVPWEHGEAIMKELKKVSFEGLTGHVEFDQFGLRKNFNIEIIEMTQYRGSAKIGNWSDTKNLEIHLAQYDTKDVKLYSNKTRIITTILSKPYLMLREKTDDDEEELVGNNRYEGYCVDLANLLAKEVGFQFELREVNDSKYGAVEPNGEWSGMVGELINHKADLAVAPLTITSTRERVIDFSKPFMSLGISIMIKKPDKQKPGVFSFMNPLSSEIWMCNIFALIAVSVVLFLVSRFSPSEWHVEDTVIGPTVTNDFTIFNSLWFSLGAFMQQGCDISPRLVA